MSKIISIDCFTVPPRWIFVRVTTDDGASGWGECLVPKRRAAVVTAVSEMARNIVGHDSTRIEQISQMMRRGAFFRHGPILGAAAAGIEIALWDLLGKRLDCPIYGLMGGAVRDHVRSYTWIGGDDPANVVDHARLRITEGFDAVKMNASGVVPAIGATQWIDALVDRMGSLRDAFGMTLDIALDFHGRVPRAALKQAIPELEPFRPMWIEEPCVPEALESIDMLARICPHIPIATGERFFNRWDFRRLLDRGGIDIVQPDVSLTGIHELAKIAHLAETYDVVVAPHCPNGPISLAASLQLGFCTTNIVIQEQSLGLHYNKGYSQLPSGELQDYLVAASVLAAKEGRIHRWNAPGLGLSLNEDHIAAAHQEWTLPDADWRNEDGSLAEW